MVADTFCVLTSVTGPKKDEITGEWRKKRNEGFCGLYS